MLRAAATGLALCASLAAAAASALEPIEIRAGDATISVQFDGAFGTPRAQWQQWIADSAKAMQAYYGRLPVRALRLRLKAREGREVYSGMTWGAPQPRIRMLVGADATPAALARDWMLPHEMVHLAFPSMDDEHEWIEEGSATYVEPIARVQAGLLSVDEVWSQLIEGLPKGLPASGDRGLDRTHTWGRTYWGGALYCLLADVQIREQTHNARGLQDALRSIVAKGGDVSAGWPIGKALAVGDAATGTHVLSTLYDEMKADPHDVDLPALWRRLGVRMEGGKVNYDDAAPGAAIRKAITAAR